MTKSREELQKELADYAEKCNIHPSIVNPAILEVGYFRSDAFRIIKKWLERECKEHENPWVAKLTSQIKELEKKPNFSQDNLNPIWLEFIKAHPSSSLPDFNPKRTKNFLTGNCAGYTLTGIETHLLEQKTFSIPQKPDIRTALIEKTDWAKTKDELHHAFKAIYHHQHPEFQCSRSHADLHKLNPNIKLLYTLVMPFSKENIELFIKEIIFANPQLEAKAEYHVMECYISANRHATRMRIVTHVPTNTNVFLYDDSNNRNEKTDPVTTCSLASDLIYAGHRLPSSENSILIKIFGLHARKFISPIEFFKKIKTDNLSQEQIIASMEKSLAADYFTSFLFWKAKCTYLIKNVTFIHVRNSSEVNFLHLAALYGRENWIAMLVSQGIDVDSQTSRTGSTALHLAAEYGFEEVAKKLLNERASLAARTYNTAETRHKDYTPMGVAIKRNRVGIVKLFYIHQVFSPDLLVTSNKNALDYAIELDRVEIAKILIQDCCVPSKLQSDFIIPLWNSSKSAAMEKMLLTVTLAGRTILEHAVIRGRIHSVKLILGNFNPTCQQRKDLLSLTTEERMRILLLYAFYFSKIKLDILSHLTISYHNNCIQLLFYVLDNNKKQIKKIFKESLLSIEGAEWQATFRAALDELPCTAETRQVVEKQIIKSQILLYQRKNQFNKLKVVGSQNLYKAIKQGDAQTVSAISIQDTALSHIAEDARRYGFVK